MDEFENIKNQVSQELNKSSGTVYDFCKRIGLQGSVDDINNVLDSLHELSIEEKAYVSSISKAYGQNGSLAMVEVYSKLITDDDEEFHNDIEKYAEVVLDVYRWEQMEALEAFSISDDEKENMKEYISKNT